MNELDDKIIAAAKEVFIRQGYEGASMSDIAAEAGITRPALHYYFRTKERLFSAVAGSIVGEIIPKVQSIIDGDLPFFDKVALVLAHYMTVYRQNPDLVFFIMNESRRNMAFLEHLVCEMQINTYLRHIIAMIQGEMAAGRIRTVPIPMLCMQILSQLTFPFLAQHLLMDGFRLDEVAFDRLLADWKDYILRELKTTLQV